LKATFGPYGPLLPPDANGIMLPPGFSSRLIAQSGLTVPGTLYPFPAAPDGAATYKVGDEWILAANSEITGGAGGVSAIRFNADGSVKSAYRILGGTSVNCAGGPTPWGTWLSGEEFDRGRIWECDPTGASAILPAPRPKMGVFQHEAGAVDPANQHVYLSEDVGDGCLYRFTPVAYPDLSAGMLEVACNFGGDTVTWMPVPDPEFFGPVPLRNQVVGAIRFARGEGMWFDSGLVYLVTTADSTIHVYDTGTAKLSILYRAADVADAPLKDIDNIHVSRSGDVFVAEDTGAPDPLDVGIISPEKTVSRFLKFTGPAHNGSEVVGLTFDPSGTRFYVGSQRYLGVGGIFEITGPFRQTPGPHPVFTPIPTATATAVPTVAPTASPTPSPQSPAPEIPIGIEVARRIAISTLISRGLPLGLTLDKAATIRVRLTARIVQKGRRRTVTLFSVTRKPGRGSSMLRFKPTKAAVKILRARRQALTANLEIRITTPGAPVRTFKRTVSLRPKKR
jgi:hypothetical protein